MTSNWFFCSWRSYQKCQGWFGDRCEHCTFFGMKSNIIGKQNRKMLFSLCFYGFCASWGLEWACSVSVRDTRRALEGSSRFVLLMTNELYRHCWKHPEERMHLRNAFPLSDAAFLYSRGGTEEAIHSHMCVSVLLVVKCWIINTGPGLCVSVIMWERI